MTRFAGMRAVPHADCVEARYGCGHTYRIPNVLIQKQRGAAIAPPVCPTCHGQAAIDKMEADNWRQDPNWSGFMPGVTQKDPIVSAALKRAMAQEAVRTGTIGQMHGQWLDKQLTMTMSRAWH